MAVTEETHPSHLAHLDGDEYAALVDDVVSGSGDALATLLNWSENTKVDRVD